MIVGNVVSRTQLVAEQILWLRREISTTPMHVLKLAYISHGFMLGFAENVLLYEPVEAWRYGPVVPSVYHRYKAFGGHPIDIATVDQSASLGDDELFAIESVEDIYRDVSALRLSSLTHQVGTPWHTTVQKYGVGVIIPNNVISRYYEKLLDETS